MPRAFDVIALLARENDPAVAETVRRLHSHLLAQGHRILPDAASARCLGETAAPQPHGEPPPDVAIVVGGDGTLLKAVRVLAPRGVALIGVNLGRLGFLVDITPDRLIERIDAILSGQYLEEKRILLSGGVRHADGRTVMLVALNDLVLHKQNVARMIEFETTIDGHFVNRQRSDGLVIATPTGSTAYALSGGGPILHPELDSLLMVPLCPHTLSQRPIVVSGDSAIGIHLCGRAGVLAQISADGQSGIELAHGDHITITRHPQRVSLLHPADYDYYGLLREKLRWGGHH